MAEKTKLPKGKGRGRWDDTHQIALLTDFEVEALNHLRWKDKDRGFSSGSGPEIKALAAKNSRPFEFVDYKGEKIPSLNDSGSDDLTGSTDSSGNTSYNYGGDGGSDSGGGYQESAWAKQKREKAERKRKADAGELRNEDGMMINEDGQIILGGRAGSGKSKRDHETDEEFANREHPMFSNKELTAMRGGDSNLHRQPGETAEEYHRRLTGVSEDSGGNETTFNPVTEPQVWTDWEGNTYNNPAEAAEANEAYKDKKFSGISGYEHEGIAEDYTSAYEQQLSDAYDAAYRGVEMDIGDTGYFKGGEFEALADAKTGQEQWLKDLGTAYEAQQKATYDTWYQDNMDKINALGSKEEVDAYEWTDPGFDLDLTGGKGFGSEDEYSADYIPDFYEGFRKEFDENYDPGQGMPDTWGGHPENVETEDAEIEGRDNNVRRVKKKSNFAPSSGISPFSSGSAKYY